MSIVRAADYGDIWRPGGTAPFYAPPTSPATPATPAPPVSSATPAIAPAPAPAITGPATRI